MKKYKCLAAITLLSLSSIGLCDTQDRDTGTENLDSINAIHHPGEDQLKDFASGTYYVFVSAAGATAIRNEDTFDYSGSGCIYETGDSGAFFDVNLQLPDGHLIRGYRYYYYDGSASSSNTILFQFHGDGTFTSIHDIVSSGDTGYGNIYEVLSGGNHVVNNANGAYVIRFNSSEAGNNQRLCGVRLFMDQP